MVPGSSVKKLRSHPPVPFQRGPTSRHPSYRGSRARLGTLSITAADVARLDDGGFGGSVLTMDRAFATLVRTCGCSLAQAARMCATTPAEDLRLTEQGRIDVGCVADFAVLDEDLSVAETWITARRAWPRDA